MCRKASDKIMMHRYAIPAFAFLLTSVDMNAQSYGELDINDVRARFHVHGLIGMDPATSSAAFEVPAGGGAHPLYAAGMWVAGLQGDTLLRVAALKYEDNFEGDYYPGPLTSDGNATTSAGMMGLFGHVWKVDQADVTLHTAYFTCLGNPWCDVGLEFPDGYTVPAYFYDWPAMNPGANFDDVCAPFYDFNGDGVYDPDDGDAPCIMGDQALFHVFNDKGGPHLTTSGLPIGIEVKAMPFAYHSEESWLDQTVFVHYNLTNRSNTTLHQARIGFFNDFDLGCGLDDHVGTDVVRNLTYVYNWDATDEDCGGVTGYGDQPPAFGMVLLKGSLLDFNDEDDQGDNLLPSYNGLGFDDEVVDNERSGFDRAIPCYSSGPACCDDPSLAEQYFNYMRGIWKDGTPLTYGGDGYSTDTSAVPAHFAYPNDSDPAAAGTDGAPQDPWSEQDLTVPDRRTIVSTAPFTLMPSQQVDLVFAYVYARASSGGPQASVAALLDRVDSVRAFADSLPIWIYESAFPGACDGIVEPQVGLLERVPTARLSLFPVPAHDQVQLHAKPSFNGELLMVRDATGRVVATHRLTSGLNTIDIATLASGVYVSGVRSRNAYSTDHIVKML